MGVSAAHAPEVVVEAIGKISNYFGSTTTAPPSSPSSSTTITSTTTTSSSSSTTTTLVSLTSQEREQSCGAKTDEENTTIGKLSHEVIGRLAGEMAEQLVGTASEACPVEVVHEEAPCYAPEKCSVPYATEESGNVSSAEMATSSEVAPYEPEMAKLEDILVTQKDIFGSPSNNKLVSDEEIVPVLCASELKEDSGGVYETGISVSGGDGDDAGKSDGGGFDAVISGGGGGGDDDRLHDGGAGIDVSGGGECGGFDAGIDVSSGGDYIGDGGGYDSGGGGGDLSNDDDIGHAGDDVAMDTTTSAASYVNTLEDERKIIEEFNRITSFSEENIAGGKETNY